MYSSCDAGAGETRNDKNKITAVARRLEAGIFLWNMRRSPQMAAPYYFVQATSQGASFVLARKAGTLATAHHQAEGEMNRRRAKVPASC